jgi:uncharacterized DUF497 family protein
VPFEFDRLKNASHLKKHGIDFIQAQRLWNSPTLEIPARTSDEPRWIVIGVIGSTVWTAVVTRRNSKIRMISVRRSRDEEKELYKNYIG